MYILGISGYAHESACALVRDGRVRCLIEEERLNREKHTWKYPERAIARCLELEGIGFRNIGAVTFFWNPRREITGNIGHMLRYFPRSLNLLWGSSGSDALSFVARIRAMRGVGRRLARQFDLPEAVPVRFIDHHLCHAASAFYLSGFDRAAVLTLDGRGEDVSTLLALGERGSIKPLGEIRVPHSLGLLYAAVTEYLGFRPYSDEWKVMGMAAYGSPALCADVEPLVELTAEGFRLDLRYFRFYTHGRSRWLGPTFYKRFGPARRPEGECKQRHFDLAYALQKTVERAALHLVCRLYEITRAPALCLAGGVALNCLMNARIIREGPFERVFVQPVAHDAGAALGSALYEYYRRVESPEPGPRLEHVYWGPEYPDGDIERILTRAGLKFTRHAYVAREAARHVFEGRVVGWFQGRMEAGPRALGNRSIVADPRSDGIRDRLNRLIKKREFFRPFAPAVLEEKAAEYFQLAPGGDWAHMTVTAEVLADKRAVIPAVTHADGSARVQTVSRRTNPRFWDLIREFEALSGVPVVLNTSFNENEPIVCSPAEAVECFLRTPLEVLAIGDFLCVKGGAAASPGPVR